MAFVTPTRRTAENFPGTSALNSAVINLNFSQNEVLSHENALTSGFENQVNTHTIPQHNYNTRRLNKRYSTPEEDIGLDANYYFTSDPFEDSGSSYSPSVASDKTNSSSDVAQNDETGNDEIQTGQKSGTEIIIPSVEVTEAETVVSDIGKDREIEDEINLHSMRMSIGKAKKNNGKRVRDKRHSCYFCRKVICNNFSRHIEMHHGDEIEAARILAMPKNSKRRRDAFADLVRSGDFYHNCEVLSLKQGQLILTRRPNKQELSCTSYSEYGPCPECLGFLLKRQLWHHLKYTCTSKGKRLNEDECKITGKGPIAESGALLNGILAKNWETGFLDIINHFRNDEISSRCKQDDTIMRYGAFLFEKYSCTQSELIRQSMRQLGRLTLEMMRQGECFQNLCEVLIPEKFDLIVIATKVIIFLI